VRVARNSNRGVTISRPRHGGQGLWRIETWGSKPEKAENDSQEIAIRSRLDSVPVLCFEWLARNSNCGFAIRNSEEQASGKVGLNGDMPTPQEPRRPDNPRHGAIRLFKSRHLLPCFALIFIAQR
jgi:hypothetical protein